MLSAGHVIAMGTILPVCDLTAVALRFAAGKRKKRRRFATDDYLIIFSMIISWALGAIMIVGAVKFGYGQNSLKSMAESGYVVYRAFIINTIKLTTIFNLLYIVSLGVTKLSVLFFYRRIFRGTTFNILSWAMICLITATTTAALFLALFQCGVPVQWLWSPPAYPAGHCWSGNQLASAFYTLDVVTDILIILIPFYWIWNLHMSRLRRLLIYGAFLFGALAIVASVARLIVLLRTYPTDLSKSNQLGYSTYFTYFGMLEVGLTIIAACLPTFGSLVSDSFRHRLSAALRRFCSSLRRFPYRFSFIKHVVKVDHPGTRFMQDNSALNCIRLETIATTGTDREIDGPKGQIRVSIALDSHSSIAQRVL